LISNGWQYTRKKDGHGFQIRGRLLLPFMREFSNGKSKLAIAEVQRFYFTKAADKNFLMINYSVLDVALKRCATTMQNRATL
jgi:hypothetical protein